MLCACATLCSIEAASLPSHIKISCMSSQAPQPDIYMYGFGSPRVGNIPFAEKFDDLVFNAWRISNLNDIVTKWVKVPRALVWTSHTVSQVPHLIECRCIWSISDMVMYLQADGHDGTFKTYTAQQTAAV